MIDLDELESLARDVGEHETWCLHPNGYSVWTGDEWEASKVNQEMIARSGTMTDEMSVKRMMLVAELSPKAVLEAVAAIKQLREDALVLAEALEKHDGYMSERFQAAFDRVTAKP